MNQAGVRTYHVRLSEIVLLVILHCICYVTENLHSITVHSILTTECLLPTMYVNLFAIYYNTSLLVLVPKWHGGKIPIYQGAFASLFFMWSISAFVTLLKFEQICSCRWLTFSNNFFPTSHFLLSFSFREKDGGGSYLHFIIEQNMCKNIFKELLLWNHLQLCIWHLLVGFWSGIS